MPTTLLVAPAGRHVGLTTACLGIVRALDRMGLVVEDRDRSNGIYYVTKVELMEEEKKGWFSSLFSGDEKKKANPHYRIKVAGEGETSVVTLLTSRPST